MYLISNLGQNSRYSPLGSSKLKLDRPASGAASLADGPCCKFNLELGYQTRRTSGETRRAHEAFSIRNLRPPRLVVAPPVRIHVLVVQITFLLFVGIWIST